MVDDDPISRAPQAPQAPHASTESDAPPPARPAMSNSTPPPVAPITTPPLVLRIARAIWVVSFIAGFGAIAGIYVSREAQLEHVASAIPDDAGASDTHELAAAIVVWGSLAAVAVSIVVEVIMLVRIMSRHGLARWGALVAVVVHGALMVAVSSLVSAPGSGLYVKWLLVAQFALAALALLVTALPASSRWLRGKS